MNENGGKSIKPKTAPDNDGGKMTPLAFVILILQGAAVGTGAILPGVSGGVLCVAFGIYEPMMALLSHPIKAFPKYYKRFIPFLISWAAGFVLLAGAVELLFETSATAALALFSGLILGTVPELMKKSELAGSSKSWAALIIPLAAAYVFFGALSGASINAVVPSIPWFVFCGAVWGLSIVVPGLSSSSVLIFMGLYQPMTSGIAALDFGVLLPLAGGLLATVLLTARTVNRLIEKQYAVFSRVVVGIMLASTLMIIPTEFSSAADVLTAALCFAAGYAAARLMDLKKKKTGI